MPDANIEDVGIAFGMSRVTMYNYPSATKDGG